MKRLDPSGPYTSHTMFLKGQAPVDANAFALGRRRGRPSRRKDVDAAVKFYEITSNDWTDAMAIQHTDGVPTGALARTFADHLARLGGAAGATAPTAVPLDHASDRQLTLPDGPPGATLS